MDKILQFLMICSLSRIYIERISADHYWKWKCTEGMLHATLGLLYNILQGARFRIFLANIHLASSKDSYSGGALDSGVFEYGTMSFRSSSQRVGTS